MAQDFADIMGRGRKKRRTDQDLIDSSSHSPRESARERQSADVRMPDEIEKEEAKTTAGKELEVFG